MQQTVLEFPVSLDHETTFSRGVFLRLTALTPIVFLIHGYHPFADDAGIYVAGIRKLLDPALYKVDAPFVLANTHLSVFAHLIAALIRLTHLHLPVALLIVHLLSIYLFLLACWAVTTSLFTSAAARWFAMALAGACFTLPAAGTALLLMDPYVTARSFSTPFGLFALAAILRRRLALALLMVAVAGMLHPLMAFYSAMLVVFYALFAGKRAREAILLGAMVILASGLYAFFARHLVVSQAYVEAVHSSARSFLFPGEWKWYEDVGLVVPLVLFAYAAWRSGAGRIRNLCLACFALGLSTALAAFLFVHSSGPYLLIRLQMLRSFHILYLAGVLLLGAWLGSVLMSRRGTRVVAYALLAAAAAGLYFTQRATFPASAHVEWPRVYPRNPWAQAFWWVRDNTPRDAVFAADPHLAFEDGTDMQGFRATAVRSLLADDKDQGVVAVMDPSLATVWAGQRDAQAGVETMSDEERRAHLKPFGVTWLLLRSQSRTDFSCPYQNETVKVCRMN